jgi:HEAT repeat protein
MVGMVRRSVLVLCATLVVALAGHDSAAQLPGPEPVYQGRTLGEWRQDLQADRPMVREQAVAALCRFEEPAVPLLVGAIADRDFNVRTLAIYCLGRLGPKARDAVPALIAALEDRDWIVRRHAAGALGLLEATAEAAAPALARTAVRDANAEVRKSAGFALGRLGPAAREAARPILQELSAAETDEAARTRALEVLRAMERR